MPDHTKYNIDESGNESSAKARFKSSDRAFIGNDTPETCKADICRAQNQSCQRDKNEKGQIGDTKTECQSEARNDTRFSKMPPCSDRRRARRHQYLFPFIDLSDGCVLTGLFCRLVDLVESASVTEMIRLCLGPTAKDWIINRHKLQLREFALLVSGNDIRLGRTIKCLAAMACPSGE